MAHPHLKNSLGILSLVLMSSAHFAAAANTEEIKEDVQSLVNKSLEAVESLKKEKYEKEEELKSCNDETKGLGEEKAKLEKEIRHLKEASEASSQARPPAAEISRPSPTPAVPAETASPPPEPAETASPPPEVK